MLGSPDEPDVWLDVRDWPQGGAMEIPLEFCWTRYGTEAGEMIASILDRKERERQANGGTFLWGIGTSIRPSLVELVKRNTRPTVVFSPMLSKPSHRDSAPSALCYWTSAVGLDGDPFELPTHSLVTSSVRPQRPRLAHYALVCESDEPVNSAPGDATIRYSELRNWLNGTNVGSSQVTCVVRRVSSDDVEGPHYRAAVIAHLRPPYLVRLTGPASIPDHIRPDGMDAQSWVAAVRSLVSAPTPHLSFQQQTLPV